MSAATYPNYSPGLEGVIGGITTISEIVSETSTLIYRGYDVHDLASKGSFEETAYLLLFGKLPTQSELDGFKKTLAEERQVPEAVYTALKQLPKTTHPMDSAKVGYAVWAPYDPDYAAPATDHEANKRKAVRILARASTIVGNGHRIRMGLEPIQPKPEHTIAQNFLHLMTGDAPDAETAHVLDSSLTLYAEHGFNASTFSARVTVATLSDLYSGICSGIGTLRGPLHGGANEEAMKMIMEIGEPSKAEAWIRDALATAAREGWREIILSDANFHDWPLGERAVVESLQAWAHSGRRMTLLARTYDEVIRRHARFVRWRGTWDHILTCRASPVADSLDIPSAIWSPEWVLHRLDPDRCVGVTGSEPERRVFLHEVLGEWVRSKSTPGFPSTTLGL